MYAFYAKTLYKQLLVEVETHQCLVSWSSPSLLSVIGIELAHVPTQSYTENQPACTDGTGGAKPHMSASRKYISKDYNFIITFSLLLLTSTLT